MIWEAADPYLYLRTTADGRVVAGGEDAPFADAAQRDALIARNNCHAVMGFGGNGITFAAVAAQYLQRTLTGLRDPDEDLFPVPG